MPPLSSNDVDLSNTSVEDELSSLDSSFESDLAAPAAEGVPIATDSSIVQFGAYLFDTYGPGYAQAFSTAVRGVAWAVEGTSTVVGSIMEAAGPIGTAIAAGVILYETVGAGSPDGQSQAVEQGTAWNPDGTVAVPVSIQASGPQVIQVANQADLVAAINQANGTPGRYAIVLTQDIQLGGDLPPLQQPAGYVQIEGGGFTLDAEGHRGLVVDNTAASISDLTIADAVAQGGTGGSGEAGGGGGAGLGGAIAALNHASVTVSDVIFQNDSAEGGAGGAGGAGGVLGVTGSGGGGGMGGAGGSGVGWQASVGGILGFLGDSFDGIQQQGASGGGGGFGTSATGGTGGSGGGTGTLTGAGGGGSAGNQAAGSGGGLAAQGDQGGWGGGGGGDPGQQGTFGGAGGFGGGGGGGGGFENIGGAGGFGGGGGGGAAQGGAGGFGGGQGAGTGTVFSSDRGAGGGGLGAGGDIFSDSTSSIAITGGSVDGGTATGGSAGGAGAAAGQHYGGAVFLAGNQVMDVVAQTGDTTTISGQIADETGSKDASGQGGYGTLLAEGGGTISLTDADNTYAGGTVIAQNTTLDIAVQGAAGSGAIIFAAGGTGTLEVAQSALDSSDTFHNGLTGMQTGDQVDLQGFAGADQVTLGQIGAVTAADGQQATLVTVSNGSATESVMVEGLNANAAFNLASDGQGGTLLQVAQPMAAPTLTEATGADGQTIYSGTADPGSTITLYQEQPSTGILLQLGTVTVGSDSNFSFAGVQPDAGAGPIVATARDALGNVSPLSAQVDGPAGTPPTASGTYDQPAPGSIVVRVGSEAQLAAAIEQANSGTTPGPLAIVLTGDITLSSDLPALDANGITILGQGHTLDGAGEYRGLMAFGGSATVADLTIADAVAHGGNGGSGASGGGGGAGLGGGLFVSGTATVVADDVQFRNDSAIGGGGGQSLAGIVQAYGGGGGLGGAGGYASNDQGSMWIYDSGGGGGVGTGAYGGMAGDQGQGIVTNAPTDTAGGGASGGVEGGGGASGSRSLGDLDGGGGGVYGKSAEDGSTGGWGGGGGGNYAYGGDGGFGGGGGGSDIDGGHGGWGGGGGGGAPARSDVGQSGGFGGGAGGAGTSNESDKGGGGGLGAGGAIFVEQGGMLILNDSGTSGDSVQGGQGADGGGSGQAYGAGLFLQGNQSVAFTAEAGQVTRITDSIADEAGSQGSGSGSVVAAGNGTVQLAGAGSTYAGGTTISGNVTLELAAANAAGTGNITFADGADATLQVDQAAVAGAQQEGYGAGFLANEIGGLQAGDAIDLQGVNAADATVSETGWSGNLTSVVVQDGSEQRQLVFQGSDLGSFTLSDDGKGGTLLKLAALQQAAASLSATDATMDTTPAQATSVGATTTEPETTSYAAPLLDGTQTAATGVITSNTGSTS